MPSPEVPSPDVQEFAFSDHGPWVVDPTALVWRPGLDRVRARTRAEVPRLLAPRRLPPVGRLSLVLARVGTALGAWYLRERGTPSSRAGLSRRLRRAFERLGSTYVKLGQIVSAFEGLFPDELVTEFKRLPRPGATRVVPRDPGARRGRARAAARRGLRRPSTRSRSRPRRSRRCTPRRSHTGEDVVVKVQRPSVAGLVRADLRGARVAVAAPRGSDPGVGARQPAGARRAVRGADRRGARLPPRSREHARPRPGLRGDRPADDGGAATASGARDAAGPRDGASPRVRVRRRRIACTRRASTRRRCCGPG